jgi:hypothetical protein
LDVSITQMAGVQPTKQAKFQPLGTGLFFTGYYTSRSPLMQPGTRAEARFYGGRPDALWDGYNLEISADNTLIRRPGWSLFNTLPEDILDLYTFRAPLQANRVMSDTEVGVYTVPSTGSPTQLFAKSSGAGRTYFQSVGAQLFMTDGIDLKKWDGTNLWKWGIAAPTGAPTLEITAGAAPTPAVLTATVAGSLTGQGTLYVRTTFVTPFGETLAGTETFLAIPNNSELVVAYPTPAPQNATGWNVYIGTAAGAETLQNSTPINLSVNYTLTTAPITSGAVPPVSATGSYTITSYLGVSYVYCYYNSVTAMPSTASPVSAYTGPQSSVNITVQGVGSSDPQVNQIQIYRTVDGGAIYELLATITNPGAVAFSYVDTGTPDEDLNDEILAPQADANNPPPTGLTNLAYFAGCIFGSVGNYLYFSNGTNTTNGSGNEAWPPLNYALLPTQITKLVPYPNGMLIFTVDDLYYITAPGGTPLIYQAGLGCLAYSAVAVSGSAIYVFTTDCNVLCITPGSGIVDLGFGIAGAFEGWNPANVSITYHIYGHKDNALFICDGAGNFLRCNPSQNPEGGQVWGTPCNVAAGLTALCSIETTAGVHQLMGASGAAAIFRDWTVNSDVTIPYEAWGVIGSLVLAFPGQLCEVESVSLNAKRVGSMPQMGVLLDEISGDFEDLPDAVMEPPQLVVSPTSLYAQRYYLNQSALPIVCHHMQIRVDFGVDTAANELLSFSIYGAIHPEK